MSIEDYLECSADKLEKMTDAELEEHFKQYIPITRPELGAIPKEAEKIINEKGTDVTKQVASTGKTSSGITNEKLKRAKEIAEQMGMGDMFKF